MPYTLVHDGVTREFDFYAPPAWQYWIARAWADEGQIGLPLMVALHGAAQEPLEFQEDWFFPEVWNQDLGGRPLIELPKENTPTAKLTFINDLIGYRRLLENQFFVLYPYGMGWSSTANRGLAYDLLPLSTIPGSTPGTTFRPLYREDRPSRGWNSGVDGVTTGPQIDDVGFIQEMMKVINQKLREEILSAAEDIDEVTGGSFPWQYNVAPAPFMSERPIEAPETLFNHERRFLFGYSNGGMMAHRLVRAMPDQWAAIWGISTTVGGKAQQGIGDPQDAVVNLPTEGIRTVSFFAHHGEKDIIAPPGREGNVVGTPDFELQSPTPLAPVYLEYQLSGIGTSTQRERYMPGFLPLAQGWRGYIDYNILLKGTVRRRRPGLLVPKRDDAGSSGPFIVGDDVGTAYSYSSGDRSEAGVPPFVYPWQANPICVMYIDPNMGHTGFTSHPNRYFFASDVWEFFRTHPQVPR